MKKIDVAQFFQFHIFRCVIAAALIGGIIGAFHAFGTADACSPPPGGGFGGGRPVRVFRSGTTVIIVAASWLPTLLGGGLAYAFSRVMIQPTLRNVGIAFWIIGLVIQFIVGLNAWLDDHGQAKPTAPVPAPA